MTASDVIAQLSEIIKRLGDGHITQARADGELEELIMSARTLSSEEEFVEIQRRALGMHHAIAKSLSEVGHSVPGNDPSRAN
jgi:hypothetical protein